MSDYVASRRTFVVSLGALLLRHRPGASHGDVLRVGFFHRGTASPLAAARLAMLARGIHLGVDEGNQTSALLGGPVLELVDGDSPERLGRTERLCALIGGVEGEACTRACGSAARSGVIYVNAACADMSLRLLQRESMVLHVAPSTEMLRGTGDTGLTSTVAWHDRLRAFGAAQLNERFRSRYGFGMDGTAWGGWFAAKVLVEAALRTSSVVPGMLMRYVMSPDARFDGHKGAPLTFRERDHQLLQPVYAVPTP